jgi:hypothetical protein
MATSVSSGETLVEGNPARRRGARQFSSRPPALTVLIHHERATRFEDDRYDL